MIGLGVVVVDTAAVFETDTGDVKTTDGVLDGEVLELSDIEVVLWLDDKTVALEKTGSVRLAAVLVSTVVATVLNTTVEDSDIGALRLSEVLATIVEEPETGAVRLSDMPLVVERAETGAVKLLDVPTAAVEEPETGAVRLSEEPAE